jgi:hypothetical protein
MTFTRAFVLKTERHALELIYHPQLVDAASEISQRHEWAGRAITFPIFYVSTFCYVSSLHGRGTPDWVRELVSVFNLLLR